MERITRYLGYAENHSHKKENYIRVKRIAQRDSHDHAGNNLIVKASIGRAFSKPEPQPHPDYFDYIKRKSAGKSKGVNPKEIAYTKLKGAVSNGQPRYTQKLGYISEQQAKKYSMRIVGYITKKDLELMRAFNGKL